jgi:dihydrofolate synthase/folylpolyglutamate synthase
MYQEPAINPSLENMKEACAAAGHPQRAFPIIQITGTNGKTSTARLVESLLAAEGKKVGLYTSPSLVCETERIRVNMRNISKDDLTSAREAARSAAASIGLRLSDFEEMTLAMFIYLRDQQVDYAVIEVGMGGRWDATSAADPKVAVITALGLDHQEFLGDSLEEIAHDKSHIIKPGSQVMLGRSLVSEHAPHIAEIFAKRAQSFGIHPQFVEGSSYRIQSSSPLCTKFSVSTPQQTYADLEIAAPAYQASNVATALFATEAALGRPLDERRVRKAVNEASFPGRFELIRKDPLLIFDGGHNPAAAAILADLVTDMLDVEADPSLKGEKPLIVLGILDDKDAEGMIAALAPVAADFITVESSSSRALPAKTLAQMVEVHTGKAVLASFARDEEGATTTESAAVDTLLQRVLNTTGKQPVIVTGSLSLYPLLQSLSLR